MYLLLFVLKHFSSQFFYYQSASKFQVAEQKSQSFVAILAVYLNHFEGCNNIGNTILITQLEPKFLFRKLKEDNCTTQR